MSPKRVIMLTLSGKYVVPKCVITLTLSGQEVAPECVAELNEMRRSLMEDYKISPELVTSCANEINTHCKDKITHRGGEMLHCLMALADNHKRKEGETISPECKRKVTVTLLHLMPLLIVHESVVIVHILVLIVLLLTR